MKTKITNWSITYRPNIDAYTAPELITMHLQGKVDGEQRLTSAIIGKRSVDEDVSIVTEDETHYLLGQVDPEYEKQFPNALLRVLATLPEI